MKLILILIFFKLPLTYAAPDCSTPVFYAEKLRSIAEERMKSGEDIGKFYDKLNSVIQENPTCFPPDKTKSLMTIFNTKKPSTEKNNIDDEKKCSSKDLRTPLLGAVRDQDSIGWCYAYTASDLLTQKLEKKISAIDLAIGAQNTKITKIINFFKESSITSGGTIGVAIYGRNYDDLGFCLESELPSDFNGNLEGCINHFLEASKITDEKKLICSAETRPVFPNNTLDNVNAILKKFSGTERLNELAKKSCKNRIKLSEKINDISEDFKNEEFPPKIDELLTSGKMVGLGYFSAFLKKGPDYKIKEGPHASSIVGRRYNKSTSECEYLVRNSWGRTCNQYAPTYQKNCEEGNIWVSRKTLARNGANFVYLK